MNLHQFLLILRARWRTALLTLVGVLLLGLAASLLLPARYRATASVVADVRAPDPIAGLVLGGVATPTWMPTQVDIITSERVALKVVKALGLERNPVVRDTWMQDTRGAGSLQQWLVEALKAHLDVKPARDSNVIAISYDSPDPALSAAVANAFAQAYLGTSVEIKVEPARQTAEWFQEQLRAARATLERTQARISEYQRAKGLVAADERLDVGTTRLQDLSAQLAALQAASADAASRERAARSAPDTLPETLQNGAIVSLKTQIAAAESRLRELQGKYGPNYPDVQRVAAALASLQADLASETGRVARSFGTLRGVSAEKEAALRAAIEREQRRLLENKQQRSELGVLLREGESAQRAYDAIAQRATQTSLESQSTQASVQLLTAAVAPNRPVAPDPPLYMLLAALGGALLAVLAAFGREIADRRVRALEDLEVLLGLPMLAALRAPRGARRVTAWMARRGLPRPGMGRLAGPHSLKEVA